MEEALLVNVEEDNGSIGIKTKFSRFHRRSNTITRGSPYQKAAALVDLAEDGIGLPEQILDQSQSRFESCVKSYFMFTTFDFIWSLNYFALIVLSFLEKPLWCAKTSAYSCSDRAYYYLGQLPYLTGAQSLIFEGITLIILIIHTFFPITYEGSIIFWKSHFTRLKVICIIMLVADFLVYALYLSPVTFDFLPLRIAPYIRVVLVIVNIRKLRDTLFVLAGMLGTYLNVLALWFFFLLFSSWLAYVMFEDTQEGKTIFTSYATTLYQLLLLFTLANNPDVWIPAYNASRWYCLFFVLYILLGFFFVANLILAVVYESFKSQLAKQFSEMDHMRKRILGKAFDLIDKHNDEFLKKEQCVQLFEELKKYRTLPKISREEFELIFDKLDENHDLKINLDEFVDLCNVIALRFQMEDVPSYFEKFPSLYLSPFSVKLKAFVRSLKFRYIICFILIVNLVVLIVETTLDIENSSALKVWQWVEFLFGWIYVVEVALKVYSFGFENYWRDGQNRFDFLITWVIVFGEIIHLAFPHGLTLLPNGEWNRYLLLARMLRLIRLILHVSQYRTFLNTFLILIPSLMPYLGTLFCVLCIYCSLGIQIFGGIVNAGNAKLEETGLAQFNYLLFNFNDYPNGMVTLFNLLVMGNWRILLQSYIDLTGTYWTLAYFISFYLITVLLLVNLIIPFVLEAFFAEMELENSAKCKEEDKDGGRKNRLRHVGSKTISHRTEVLLRHMLSVEPNKSCNT